MPNLFRVVVGSATVLALGTMAPAHASWLTVEDPIEPCPALVVLNGDPPARVDEAERLYRARVAPTIWLTVDPRSGEGGGDAGTE